MVPSRSVSDDRSSVFGKNYIPGSYDRYWLSESSKINISIASELQFRCFGVSPLNSIQTDVISIVTFSGEPMNLIDVYVELFIIFAVLQP